MVLLSVALGGGARVMAGDSGHCFMLCLGPSTVPTSLKSGYQKSMGQQPVIEVVRVRKKKGDDLAAAGSHISRFLCSSLVIVL